MEEIMEESVAVVGAGMGGMCTALALAKRGCHVTVFERDAPPPEGGADEAFFKWKRQGAAQFRHPHVFLGLMCNLLQDNYPDLLDDFYQAGARRLNFADILSPELSSGYQADPGDEKLWMLMCRRATMETVLRRYVERTPQIEILNTCKVVNIDAQAEGEHLNFKGLVVNKDNRETTFAADIVIDASGRTSRFPGWFKDRGMQIREEKHHAEIVYYTRHYQLQPGAPEPPRNGKNRSAGDLGYLKYGVFPGDNGHFAVIICVPVGEDKLKQAVRDGEKFDAICKSIPGVRAWVVDRQAKVTTEPFGIGDIQAVWRHYVNHGKPLALNFFAVGDAAMRTNPLYGRGCSTSILHAHILARLLEDVADPVQRALEFDRRSEAEIRPIFKASLRDDKRGIKRALAVAQGDLLDKPDSLRKWFGFAFRDAVAAASRQELGVMRGVMRTFNLLEKPGAFLKDWRITLTILRYMVRGRHRNARARIQSGPGREEMHRVIEANVS